MKKYLSFFVACWLFAALVPLREARAVSLADAINALEICADKPANGIDLTKNNTAGLEDAIYALRTVAASRNALIYNGQFADPDGAEAVSKLAGDFGLKTVWFNQPNNLLELLKNSKMVVIGGTVDEINPFIESFTPDIIQALKGFIDQGGIYLGICGGGYIASSGWEENSGFVEALGLVPFESDSYLLDAEPQVIQIEWNQKNRMIYYQFGPKFLLPVNAGVNVLARYDDRSVAAFSKKTGKGKIVLVGPHPEADNTWLDDSIKNASAWKSTADIAQEMMAEALRTE